MIRTLLHILSHKAMAALLCAAVTACSSDSGPGATGDDVDSDEVRLVLTLAMNAPATRANNTGWDDYDPTDKGNDYENRINPDDVQVLIYSSTGNLLGYAQNISVYTDGTSLMVIGSVPVTNTELVGTSVPDAKIMVLANCGNQSIGADTDLGGLTFSWDFVNYKAKYIPMWGVTTQNLNLQAGKRTDLGEIWLLRAVAKIEVSLDKRMPAGISIEEVSINNANIDGYCLPKEYNSVSTTRNLTFDNTMSIPTDVAQSGSSVSFTAPTSPTEPTSPYSLYLPEYDNTPGNGDKGDLSLTVTLHDENATGDDATKEYIFPFAYYNDDGSAGTLLDVMRNHWYKFTVYRSGNELKLKATVEDWTKMKEETLPLEPKPESP